MSYYVLMCATEKDYVVTEYLVRYGRAGTIFMPTERRARNQIKKLLEDTSWRRGFQNDTAIQLSEVDDSGTPHLIETIEVTA